jgi:hypothetical protein
VEALLVRDAPETPEVVDGAVLGTGVDAEAHRVSIHDHRAEVVPRDGRLPSIRVADERSSGSGKRGGRREVVDVVGGHVVVEL